MKDSVSIAFISVCTRREVSEAQLSEVLESVRDFSPPDVLVSKDVEIDATEPSDLYSIFSEGQPQQPRIGEYSAIECEIESEQTLHIHSYVTEATKSAILDSHTQLSGVADDLDVDNLQIFFEYSGDFEDLDINVDKEEVKGVRFSQDGFDISVTNVDEDVRGTVEFLGDEQVEPSSIPDLVTETTDDAIKAIQQLTPHEHN